MSLRSVVAGGAAFGITRVAIGVGFAALAVRSAARFSNRPGEAGDNLAMAAYLALVAAGFSTIGYLLVTLVARAWGDRPIGHAIVAGTVMGGVAFLVQLSGVAFALPFPLAWTGDGGGFSLSWAPWMIPGVLCGVLTALLSRLIPPPGKAA